MFTSKPLTSTEKEIVVNVHNHFKKQLTATETQSAIADLTASATGVSKRSIFRMIKEKTTTGKLRTPGKSRPKSVGKRVRMMIVDDFLKTAFRRKVHEFF
jgi:hypothetical protein